MKMFLVAFLVDPTTSGIETTDDALALVSSQLQDEGRDFMVWESAEAFVADHSENPINVAYLCGEDC